MASDRNRTTTAPGQASDDDEDSDEDASDDEGSESEFEDAVDDEQGARAIVKGRSKSSKVCICMGDGVSGWQVRKTPKACNQRSERDWTMHFPARAVEIAQLAHAKDWDVMVDRHREWQVRAEL